MQDLKNILKKNKSLINNQQLQDYLSGNLPAEEQFNIEKDFDENDEFLQDAIDGLKDSKINTELNLYEINDTLKKKLKLKEKKQILKLNSGNITLIAIVLTLTLIVIGFYIIKLYLKK